jgi:hypothetical protein
VFIIFLVCAFICHRSDPFSSILSFGHHRPSGDQDSSPACLVPYLACSDFLGSEIFSFAPPRSQVKSDFLLSLFFPCSHQPLGSILVGFSVRLVSSSRSDRDSTFFQFSAAVFFFRLETFSCVDIYSCLGCDVTKLLI